MPMPITRRRLLAASPLLLSAVRPARAQAQFDFKVGCDTPADHPLSLRLGAVAQQVAERTGGRLTIKVFPNSQLGGDSEMLSQNRAGALELFAAPSLTLSTLVPLSGLPSVGYAFASYDKVWAAMDGALGALVRAAIAKTGLVALGRPWDNGFRQVSTATHAINGPDDFAGLKLRVPTTALLTSLFRSLGAAPTSINFNEVYSALQTHVVDGQENPLAQIETAKLFEVQKFVAMTNHCWSGYWIVASRRTLARLPDDVRATLEDALDTVAMAERTDLAQNDDDMHAQLAKQGIAFTAPAPALFQQRLQAAGFYKQWQQTFGAEAWSTLEQFSGPLA